MPVCNGLQILEQLRRAGWRIPVILVTAFSESSMHAHVNALGAQLFIKPFDVDALASAALEMVPCHTAATASR